MQKHILWMFWIFSAWICAKLAPIYSKMHLQHDSMPFFPPALHFYDIFRQHVQKLKFGEILSLGFQIFFLPFLCLRSLSFCGSDCPSTWLASSSKISEKVSLIRPIFTTEYLSVVTGNFAEFFTHISELFCISGYIELITLIWVSLERSFHPSFVFVQTSLRSVHTAMTFTEIFSPVTPSCLVSENLLMQLKMSQARYFSISCALLITLSS